MSRQTAAENLNLDYGFERANIEQDRKEDLENMEAQMKVQIENTPQNGTVQE